MHMCVLVCRIAESIKVICMYRLCIANVHFWETRSNKVVSSPFKSS